MGNTNIIPTTPKSRKYVVVAVEGIIGCGKTTLINKYLAPLLKKRAWEVALIDEPIDEWRKNGLLQAFYDDPKRWGHTFQTHALSTRVQSIINTCSKLSDSVDIVITERSIYSDYLFMDNLFQNKIVNEMEMETYKSFWKFQQSLMPFEPDLFLYLRPDLVTCMKRMESRGREEEKNMPTEYQMQLLSSHDNYFGKPYIGISEQQGIPCQQICTNEDFENSVYLQSKIVNYLEQYIYLNRKRRGK